MEGIVKHKWGTEQEYHETEINPNELYFVGDFSSTTETEEEKTCALYAGEYRVIGPNNGKWKTEIHTVELKRDTSIEGIVKLLNVTPSNFSSGSYLVDCSIILEVPETATTMSCIYDTYDNSICAVLVQGDFMSLVNIGSGGTILETIDLKNADGSTFHLISNVKITEENKTEDIELWIASSIPLKAKKDGWFFNNFFPVRSLMPVGTRMKFMKLGDDENVYPTPPEPTEIPSNQIWYWTNDGESGLRSTFNENSGNTYFGATFVSNDPREENNKWVMEFESPITKFESHDRISDRWDSIFGDNVTRVEIPDGIRSIGECSFKRCESLTSVTMPDSVTGIGDYAFSRCSSLPNIDFLASGITEIGTCSFEYCSGLTSITIPENTVTISGLAFLRCTNAQLLYIPENVETITSDSFEYCGGFTSITVSQENQYYDSRCNALVETATNTLMRGCHNTIIDNTIEVIGNGAFSSIIQAFQITIPRSVTHLGNYVFENCAQLQAIRAKSLTAPTIETNYPNTFYGITRGGTLYYPTGGTGYAPYGWMYYLNNYGWTAVEQDE